MFLRRSLASLARAIKYIIIFVGTFGGLAPPPPQYQKAGYATGAVSHCTGAHALELERINIMR